ncbi:hypothetical protein J2X01_002620 [Arthrobacter ginsengisoli]|uniref:Uncharacterized protein n=1 Tax=Arthrobacter ginsengisoli TaxID=1356565 RepID=A0ABU1UDS3_9MICC|nr:hypothetical protein [Arthrobacter ginsengisoli]
MLNEARPDLLAKVDQAGPIMAAAGRFTTRHPLLGNNG